MRTRTTSWMQASGGTYDGYCAAARDAELEAVIIQYERLFAQGRAQEAHRLLPVMRGLAQEPGGAAGRSHAMA
jgi:hypothetical protein